MRKIISVLVILILLTSNNMLKPISNPNNQDKLPGCIYDEKGSVLNDPCIEIINLFSHEYGHD